MAPADRALATPASPTTRPQNPKRVLTLVKVDLDTLGLARLEVVDLLERLEGDLGVLEARGGLGRGSSVEVDTVVGGDAASVGDVDRSLEAPVGGGGALGGLDLEVVVLEARVRETVAEGEERLDAASVVVLVADPNALLVVDTSAGRLEVLRRGNVTLALGEGDGETTGGNLAAVDDVGDGVTGLVTAVPGLHDTGDLVDPGHRDGRAALEDNNSVGVGLGDGGDEVIAAEGE